MIVLGIETSCDDTCAAVLNDTCVLSNIVSSQVDLHRLWGGVVPDIAKRAHQKQIQPVVNTALKKAGISINQVDMISVTRGPGLAIALSVGVNYAKELSQRFHIPILGTNHIEAHLLSVLLKNKSGKPEFELKFPCLGLTVSGGHTKIVLIKSIDNYQVVGETLDDAAGEALDKAAKLLGLGYPGGPVIERIATKSANTSFLKLPQPLQEKRILNLSFSGLKTSFYYQIKDWSPEKIVKNLSNLSATFQSAVFEHLTRKFCLAIDQFHPKSLLASGGVLANLTLRRQLHQIAKTKSLPIYFPPKKIYNTDNAAMVALTGYYHQSDPVTDFDISPRLDL